MNENIFDEKVVPFIRKSVESMYANDDSFACSFEKQREQYLVSLVDDNEPFDEFFIKDAVRMIKSCGYDFTMDSFLVEWLEKMEILQMDYREGLKAYLSIDCVEQYGAKSELMMKLNEYSTEVDKWLYDHIAFNCSSDAYATTKAKRTEVCVNIMLATAAESNLDMGCYQYVNSYGEGTWQIDDDCALMWMCRRFGYGTEMRTILNQIAAGEDVGEIENPFLQSVVEKLENFSDVMGGVTLLVKMSLWDFMRLKNVQKCNSGCVVIDKKTDCGIYNPWIGGGSVLEIKLPNDLSIPAAMLKEVWIDGSKTLGYDPSDVYGIGSSAWTPIVAIKDPVSDDSAKEVEKQSAFTSSKELSFHCKKCDRYFDRNEGILPFHDNICCPRCGCDYVEGEDCGVERTSTYIVEVIPGEVAYDKNSFDSLSTTPHYDLTTGYYKDDAAFEGQSDKVCYVPENAEYYPDDCYTYKDILEICNNQPEIASMVFHMLDWKSPETEVSSLSEIGYIACEHCGKIFDAETDTMQIEHPCCPFCGKEVEIGDIL